jgi:glycosyltransferase involved in cell wall biosynthesis
LVAHEEVAALLQSSHVLISASRIETFGKAILEAQACGLPVIATKTDGAEFILQSPEQGLLIEKENAQALAEAMMTMKKEYFRYKSTTIEHAISTRFSRDVVIPQWKELYQRCTA